jgi:tetratricopeptide (TPR) repeat protein
MRQGHLDEALRALREALGLEPRRAEAHALLALVLVDLGRLRAARHEARRAVELAPQEPRAHGACGLTAAADGDDAAAVVSLSEAIRLAPTDAFALRALARAHLRRGETDAAGAAARRAEELAPGAAAHALAGELALAAGDAAAALKLARAALAEAPGLEDARVLEGRALARAGSYLEARERALALARDGHGARALDLYGAARPPGLARLAWSVATHLSRLGEPRALGLVLAAYLVQRAVAAGLLAVGVGEASGSLQVSWLVVAGTIWLAPALARRALTRALRSGPDRAA